MAKPPRKKSVKKRKSGSSAAKVSTEVQLLKGWQEIARFLGQPVSVAERWGHEGMPVKKQGRFVTALPNELNVWLGREAGGEPIHVATDNENLAEELQRGLAYIRKQDAPKRKSSSGPRRNH